MDRAGRRYRVPMPRETPRLCTCQNYCPATKPEGAPSGLCASCPRPPQVPSGLPCHEEVYVIPCCPGQSHVYTDHLHPWIPCSSQGNRNGCHPGIGSGLLGSWFPYLYLPPAPHPKKRGLKDPQAGCIHPTSISLSPISRAT